MCAPFAASRLYLIQVLLDFSPLLFYQREGRAFRGLLFLDVERLGGGNRLLDVGALGGRIILFVPLDVGTRGALYWAPFLYIL